MMNKYMSNIRVICVGHFGIPAHHRSRRLALFSLRVLTWAVGGPWSGRSTSPSGWGGTRTGTRVGLGTEEKQRSEAMKCKYFVTVLKRMLQVAVPFLAIFFRTTFHFYSLYVYLFLRPQTECESCRHLWGSIAALCFAWQNVGMKLFRLKLMFLTLIWDKRGGFTGGSS